MAPFHRVLSVAAGGAAVVAAGYAGLVTGAISIDLGLGRRLRPLGRLVTDIDAPREVVFDVISQPYLGRQTRALAKKVRILERTSDMVLAAHYTPVSGGLVAQTVETVRFTPPQRVDFRLVRGPVPHVVEQFLLVKQGKGTRLEYRGEMGTDLWVLGGRWGDAVAHRWEEAVAASLASVKAEAERRVTAPNTRGTERG